MRRLLLHPQIQTWNLMPHNRRLRRLLQRVCKRMTGHSLSATEFGYGGGDFVDRHCRWCDQLIQEPYATSHWAHRHAQLVNMVGAPHDR